LYIRNTGGPMRIRLLKSSITFFLVWLFSTSAVFAETTLYSIDPNGEQAPEAVRNLNLSFRMNQANILAPYILITEDDQRGFVNYINAEDDPDQAYVLVIRPLETEESQRIERAIPVGENPAFMIFNPTQTELWVVNLGEFGTVPNYSTSIHIIDVDTLDTIAVMELPDAIFGFGSNLLFTPGGSKAFISSTYTDEVLKIDTATYQVEGRLLLEAANPYYYTSVGPTWLTMSPDTTFICSTNTTNNTVSVIDTDALTERHQIIFQEEEPVGAEHVVNFSFRNNVLLSDDGTIGMVASIGNELTFFTSDQILFFDPITGQKMTNDDGTDMFLPVNDSPATIQFDPTGELLIVMISSYDSIDTTGLQGYGFPTITIFKWPTLELYKTLQFRRPPFNMSRTTQMVFVENIDGTYDILFPSFSSYDQIISNYFYETIVRVPTELYEQCSIVQILNDSDEQEVPVTLAQIPGTDKYILAEFLTGILDVVLPQKNDVNSTGYSVYIEDGHFSSVAFLNLQEDSVTYRLQSIQTDNTDNPDDGAYAGLPFFWVDDEDVTHFIDAVDFTLEPGQQHVRMFEQLIPDYDKVVNQHGFLKAINPTHPLQGLIYNGSFGGVGEIVRGDYLRIDQSIYQDVVFPFLSSGGNYQNTLHYTNPYFNQYDVDQHLYSFDGTPAADQRVTVTNTTGIDQRFDFPATGYIRIFNVQNLKTNVYMVYESIFEDQPFLFTCPPLEIDVQSRTQAYHLPYYAVGGGYDTSVILISFNNPVLLDEEGNVVEDENGDPIPLYTHAQMDFYDVDDNYMYSKEFDFQNTTRLEVFFSSEEAMNVGRYGEEIYAGSVVINVDHDFVVGAYTYTQWALFEDPEDPDNPLQKIQNMTVDALPQTQDVRGQVVFPFTINIPPFETSYVLYNPGDQAATVRIEVYDPDGNKIAESLEDQTIPSQGNFIYFLGDSDIFGAGAVPDNFVGYMKVISTNGRPFLAKSIQGSPDMMALIPTL